MTPIYEEVLVDVQHVSKSYDDLLVLRDINIQIRNVFESDGVNKKDVGQIVAILGQSGAGKSTISNIIAGILEPTSGQVLVRNGAELHPTSPAYVGMVTQNYIMFDHRTIYSNLYLAASRNPEIKPQDRDGVVKQALATYRIEDRGPLYPCQLSGGQRQRAAIARQMLAGSKVLLADEPFSGLDLIMKEKVCKTFKDVAESDGLHTSIVVTHDLAAATIIADQLWMMGYDYDPKGNKIPGAYIKYQYDLAELGLAWHEDISETKEFHDFMRTLYEQFHKL